MRQASRRSWRIGQHQPVEVTHLAYKGTLQVEALALVAAKMCSALMIEGELSEDDLSALVGDKDDAMLTLARRLADRDPAVGQSLAMLFPLGADGEALGFDLQVSGDDALIEDDPHTTREMLTDGSGKDQAAPHSRGREVTFDKRAQLIRPPKPQKRSVPIGQLSLFGA